MDVGGIVLLSSQTALRRRLDLAANNLANADTAGFRREQTVFRTIVSTMADADGPARAVSYPVDVGRVHDGRAGGFNATGDPLHVMIDGPGWLQLGGPDGPPRYSRAGGLRLAADGALIGPGGLPVRDAAGSPIRVPADIEGVAIRPDGALVAAGVEIARLGLYAPPDAEMVQQGDSVWLGPPAPALPPGDVKLRPGGVEASNVQPIVETTELVDIMRDYQASQGLASGLDELRRRGIERLGRLNN